MAKADGMFPRDVEKLFTTLRSWLRSEISVSGATLMKFDREKEQEGVEIRVQVRNAAPSREDGGEVVFIGVGLRILDGRDRTGRPTWISGIRKTRPSDRQDIRQGTDRGTWVAGSEWPREATANEESFGEVLFPGESVIYQMQTPTTDLPYIRIKVEGTVSRRHLFHFIRTMEGLEPWTRPLLLETFRALKAANIHRPALTATSALPKFGPKTTLEEVTAFRQALKEAMAQISQTNLSLNTAFHSAPGPEIRDLLKQVVGQYLVSLNKACANTLEALSTGDTGRMHEATDSLKQQLAAAEEVNFKMLQVMSGLGITPDEAGIGG